MAGVTVKSLLKARTDAAAMQSLLAAFEVPLALEEPDGSFLLGSSVADGARIAVLQASAPIGFVIGPESAASALAALLGYLAEKEAARKALAAEVLHLYREVHLIDHLSEQLAALLDVQAVCESALAQAHRLIKATSGGIFLKEASAGPLRAISSFGDERRLPAADAEEAESHLAHASGIIRNAADAGAHSLLLAPLRAKQRTLGFVAMVDDRGEAYAAADLKLLNTIALQTAAAIENSLLCAEMVDHARNKEQLAALQKELDTARAIQQSMLPQHFPPFPERPEFDLHAQMTAARSVGGDFFDFFLIDDDHLGIVVGDVSGKGTASALYMAVTHTHMRTVALRGMPPGDCLGQVNRTLLRDKASDMFATCFYGILNTCTGELRYSSAGHNPPYLIGSGGELKPLSDVGGTPLGMMPWKEYGGGATFMQPGDCLFVYTDGVSEAVNADFEDFGDERLLDVLQATASQPSRAVVESVNSHLLAFTAGAPQADDITMVTVQWNG